MEALLGGLGVTGFGADTPRPCDGCRSIEDLQAQLHDTLAPKTSETRAEHVSATLLLRSGATVVINEEPPNARADDAEQPAEMPTRAVDVTEMIQNQPADNPALQGAVAKHITSAMGAVDDSIWIVREVSKTAQGWTFTYLCKQSTQSWKRQNAKKSGRPPIALCSGFGGQDPVNISRPAFDCRGTLTIAFSKSSRAIVVKYEHTLLHQTVAQLLDRLAPAIPPPSVPNHYERVANRSTKAKRPPPAAGEESGRKKRKNNRDEDNNQCQIENVSQDQHPEAAPTSASTSLNISPATNETTNEIGLDLQNGRGVDPATSSAEQFRFFASQASHPQEVSLDTMVEYGVERPGITGPGKEQEYPTTFSFQHYTPPNEANGSSITAAGGAPAGGVDGFATAKATPPRGRRTRGACDTCKKNKRKCTKQHPQCSVCVDLGETCVYLPPKPRKKSTLSTHFTADDLEVGNEGGQAAQQEAEQADEQDAGQGEQVEPPNYTIPASQLGTQRTENAPATPDLDSDEFIPDPNILSGPIDPPVPAQPPGPSSHDESDVSHGPSGARSFQASSHHSPVSSRLSFSRTQIQRNAHPPAPGSGYSDTPSIHPAQQLTGVSFPTPTTTSQDARQSISSDETIHNLPTTPSLQAQGVIDASTASSAPPAVDWSNVPSLPANTNAGQTFAHSPSPTISYQTTKRPRSRMSVFELKAQGPDPIQTAAARQIRSSPVNEVPYQNPGQKSSQRASPRHGHRAQTHTPMSQTHISPSQESPSHTPNALASYSHQTTATSTHQIPVYNPYTRLDTSSNDPYSKTGASRTTRIAYEPNSYKQALPKPDAAYSSNSYSYSSGGSSANTVIQALHGPTDYSTAGGRSSNLWEGSRDRASPSTSNQYGTAGNSHPPTYGTHSTDRQGTAPDTTYNQPTQQPAQSQQSYRSFSQQPDTRQHQETNWYGFSSVHHHTNSAGGEGTVSRGAVYDSTPAAANTGYNQSHRGAAPGYHGYGEEHDIYELLRTGGSH